MDKTYEEVEQDIQDLKELIEKPINDFGNTFTQNGYTDYVQDKVDDILTYLKPDTTTFTDYELNLLLTMLSSTIEEGLENFKLLNMALEKTLSENNEK